MCLRRLTFSKLRRWGPARVRSLTSYKFQGGSLTMIKVRIPYESSTDWCDE